ncbi:MAG: SUMF1/EgtB/PvdO family nonheme iron enzyme, partial [Candidatus Kapaibacterium sp.]
MLFVIATLLLLTLWLPHNEDEREEVLFSDAEYVCVKSGTYTVGAKGHPSNPERKVALDSFYILSHEVTNREFARFIESSQYQTDAERLHHGQVAFVGMQDWEWYIDETAYWRFPHGAEGPCVDSLPDYPVTQISY